MVSRGPTSENSDMENVNKPASSWPLKQGPKSGQNMAAIRDLDSGNRAWDATFMFKLQGRKSACTICAGSSEILRWLTPFLGPNMDPKNGVQNWITFSFLPVGLCFGSLGSRFGPKSGVSHRRILLLPAEVLQADLRRTCMSVSVNTCFFSLCVPLCFLYKRNTLTDPPCRLHHTLKHLNYFATQCRIHEFWQP